MPRFWRLSRTSRLERVRAEVADMLLGAVAGAAARVIVARSADFLGPGGDTSIAGPRLFAGVINKTTPRRRVEWIGNPGTRHCWNGTPSIAAALVRWPRTFTGSVMLL